MTTAMFIAGLGALGGLTRYYLSNWVYEHLGRAFPYGTFAVNIIGAFFIGLLMDFSLRSTILSPNLRLGLAVGFLGGLTTFSTFSYETFKLLEDGQFLPAFGNILANVVACLALTWAGIFVARQIV